MRMRKGQTAMEYLMTYGWAILIIMVVLAVLFYLGVLNPPVPSQCTFPAGFTCVTYKLSATSGKLYLVVGQGTGHSIRVLGINCTKNSTVEFSSSGQMNYGVLNNFTMSSGSQAILSSPTAANCPSGTACLNISCTDVDGTTGNLDTTIGAQYSGKIYVKYIETDTGLQRIVLGTLSTKYEA